MGQGRGDDGEVDMGSLADSLKANMLQSTHKVNKNLGDDWRRNFPLSRFGNILMRKTNACKKPSQKWKRPLFACKRKAAFSAIRERDGSFSSLSGQLLPQTSNFCFCRPTSGMGLFVGEQLLAGFVIEKAQPARYRLQIEPQGFAV